jgi:hypothetical protein
MLVRLLESRVPPVELAAFGKVYLERRAYLMALQAACSGLENARVVLAKARQRIECPERYGRPRPGACGEAGWDTA